MYFEQKQAVKGNINGREGMHRVALRHQGDDYMHAIINLTSD